MKKGLSIILCLVMVLSLFNIVPFSVGAAEADVSLVGAPESYTDIRVGETKTATIENGGETAYFKFVPKQNMRIEFTSLSDEDTAGYLYSANMTKLTNDNDSGEGENFKITYSVTAGTTYYFGARFYSYKSTGSFDVRLQELVYPEIKVGETKTVTIEGSGKSTSFKFVPEQDMIIEFTSLSDERTEGYLYDANMRKLDFDDDSGKDSNFKIVYKVTAGTTYYLNARFYSYSSTGSFDVQLQELVCPEIKVGETKTVTIEYGRDIDYFKFVPEQDMRIDFTSLSDKDTYGYLYDADLKYLEHSYSSSGFKITYAVTAGTTYYFGARYNSPDDTGSFDVHLEEHVFKVGETLEAMIGKDVRIDYFKFVPEQDMTIEFTSLSDKDTYGYLYDADMNQLASDDNSGAGSNFKIIQDVTAGTTYYFGARYNTVGTTGSFNVKLQEFVCPEIKVGETATATIENGETAFFKFVPEQDMMIDFTSLSDSNTRCYLYDANMKRLAYDYDSGEGNNFRIIYKVNAGTTYYFGTELYSGSTGSFDVQLQEYVYPEIRVGETATATIRKSGETACFKFVPEQDMNIDFTSLSETTDTYGYLYNADMEELASDGDSGSGNNFRIIYHVTAGTTYYFGAKIDRNNSTGSFDVQLKTIPEIRVGETAAALIEHSGETACFEFVPEQDMRIVFTSLSSSDTYGYLYDADMKQLTSDDDKGSGSNFKIIYNVTAGTTYYFGAKYSDSSSAGSFDVQLQEHVYPEIKVGETKSVMVEESDEIACFKFVPEQDMFINFTSQSSSDTYGYLYNADMEELASNDDSGSGSNFKIIYKVTAGTTYYLGAKLYNSSGSFKVELQELLSPEIGVGETKTVKTASGQNIAYFKFVCQKDMMIGFSAELSTDDWNNDLYTYGYLYDANMEEITSESDKEFSFVYSVSAGQTYYLGASIGTWFDGDFYARAGTFDVTLKEVKLWEHDGSEIIRYNGNDEDVTIPSELDGVAVTSIGESAFYNCEALKSVTIPDSVTSIGGYAFGNCTSLESVTIPDSVTSVGDYAFYGTPWENSLPDGLAYVGKAAYKMIGDCPAEVVIKDGTSSISGSAFYGCTSLGSVTIPKSVTSIGNRAFYGCTSLGSVTIPNSVESIGEDAFGYYYDDDEWEECKTDGFTIYGYEDTAAKTYAFDNGFTFVTVYDTEGETGDCRWSVDGTVLTIYGNGKMGDYDWHGAPWNPDITEVIIEDGVTNIGEYAFFGYESLTSVTIGNSVTSIGDSAFSYCTGLTSVTIPNAVTSIGNGAFSGCTKLTSITIPDSVTSIGRSAFSGCTGLTSVTIPDSVTSIGDGAFRSCTGLKSVTIGDSVTSIGDGAFSYCTGLTSVTIPDSVESIGDSAFTGCTGLKSVTIPDSVTSIGYRAFKDCTGLTSITIGDSVTSIGKEVFYGCTGLLSITVDPENTVYDSRENCNAVISTNSNEIRCGCITTVIPSSVTSIGEYAFSGCTELTSMTIPDSVTSIGFNAFEGCTNLKSVTIPASVTSIGNFAFGWKWYNSGYGEIDGFTIYGYAGTAAETYANDNTYFGHEDGFTFIALSDKADSDTGIFASVTEDVTLDVKDITGTDAVGNIRLNGKTILKAYDITFTKGGVAVQPEHMVTVKIPCTNPDAKVYRVEADGSLTDMHSVYENGYLVFTTDHLGVYIVGVSDAPVKPVIGDTNLDGSLTISDVTEIQKHIAEIIRFSDEQLLSADTNGDGEVNISDATHLQKYLAEYDGIVLGKS